MASKEHYMLRLTPEETLICTMCGGVIRGAGEIDPSVNCPKWTGSTAHFQVSSNESLFVSDVWCNECIVKERR